LCLSKLPVRPVDAERVHDLVGDRALAVALPDLDVLPPALAPDLRARHARVGREHEADVVGLVGARDEAHRRARADHVHRVVQPVFVFDVRVDREGHDPVGPAIAERRHRDRSLGTVRQLGREVGLLAEDDVALGDQIFPDLDRFYFEEPLRRPHRHPMFGPAVGPDAVEVLLVGLCGRAHVIRGPRRSRVRPHPIAGLVDRGGDEARLVGRPFVGHRLLRASSGEAEHRP
jgi:hypothetical protein